MSVAISLRDYVVGGLVSLETVNELLTFGEPMMSERMVLGWTSGHREYRAWIRLRQQECACAGGRVMGHPWQSTPQFAATALLEKLRGER